MTYLFTEPYEATHTLEFYGFSDIRITGWTSFGCGSNQPYHTRFTGLDEYGYKTSGVVCSGYNQGSTITVDNQ